MRKIRFRTSFKLIASATRLSLKALLENERKVYAKAKQKKWH